MGDLEFKLNSTDIHQNSEITGTITVSYPGRYDGVVVNTTILDSNEHIIYKYSRLLRYIGINLILQAERLIRNLWIL